MVDWAESLENLNYWAVLIGAIAPFVVGFLWYSKGAFLTRWAKETGISEKQMNDPSGMPAMFGGTLVLNLIASFVLGLLMYQTEGSVDGILFGASVGLAFGATALGTHYLFARKSMELFAIDAGNTILSLAVMGFVHGMIN